MTQVRSAFTATAVLVLAGLVQAQIPQAIPGARPVRSCESLATITLPNTKIESAAVDSNSANVCKVTATVSNPPANDRVTVWFAIPMSNWNGRFLGTGGGGFSGGNPAGVNQPATTGYAAGATDTGHAGGSGSFAMDANGRLDWQSVRDNAHVGIHEMTVTGKALTEALYGTAPKYSYFTGCSTGGRQALMEAQRYPLDYNGVVAGAPAINWPKLMMQSIWGSVQMNLANNPVAPCKLAIATAAAVEACDAMDGVKDGVIENPTSCAFDPRVLVGKRAGECGAFTEGDAKMIRTIWDGPRRPGGGPLWYGQSRGADLNALAGSRGTPLKPAGFAFTIDWLRYWLTQNKDYDWTTMTADGYDAFWNQSVEEFGTLIGTDNPDLSAFRDGGGKAIIWHGWADPLITAQGTIDYYNRVVKQLGGAGTVSQFARLFLAPGVGHCGGGAGPAPTGLLDALVSWVESGKAPETLTASRANPPGPARTRPLCQYPSVARYRGSGSTDEAGSFVCTSGF